MGKNRGAWTGSWHLRIPCCLSRTLGASPRTASLTSLHSPFEARMQWVQQDGWDLVEMHRDPECIGYYFPSNAVPDLSAAGRNVRQEPLLGFSPMLVPNKQWGVRRKVSGQFFCLCTEKFKSTQLFKSPGESTPPGVPGSGTLAAVGSHGGTWGENKGECF